MNWQIMLGILLTVLPVFELRGGLPIVVNYAVQNNLSVWPYFFLILALNILIIGIIFLFLDFLHERLLIWKPYRRVIDKLLRRIQKRVERVEKAEGLFAYIILFGFVAIPFPGTGAWTGTLISWILGLNRKKSFVAIAGGVIVAGILILLASLGLFGIFH